MSARPTFSPNISLGNALQIVTMIVMVVAGYVVIDQRSTANTDAIRELSDDLRDVTRDGQVQREGIAVRVRYLETQAARVDERYSAMMGLLQRIDARLARIEEGGGK